MTRSRPLLPACALCVAALVGLAVFHAWNVPFYGPDDQMWLDRAGQGLGSVWTEPHPWGQFRPVFPTWLLVLRGIGTTSPGALAVAGLALSLAVAGIAAWASRPLVRDSGALLAAVLLFIHPARESHLFWTSAQIDALCLALSLFCIGLAVRCLGKEETDHGLMAGIAAAAGLAALSKEIALALPLVVALLPGRSRWLIRAKVVGASLAGAVVAAAAGLFVLRGPGRPLQLLMLAEPSNAFAYPSRLLWPFRSASWVLGARFTQTLPIALGAAFLGLGALAALGVVLRRWGREAWARAGIALIVAGALPWIVRPDDRGIGLGCAGMAILCAGALARTDERRRGLAAAALLGVALVWSPLWLESESRSMASARLSRDLMQALRTWRREAGEGPLLAAVGRPYAWGMVGPRDLDRCSLAILSASGVPPASPPDVSADPGTGRLRVTAAPGSVLAWPCRTERVQGVVEVECDPSGRVLSAVIELERLRERSRAEGCNGLEVRQWDGTGFVPVGTAASRG